jgi:hypothetical protein
LAWNNDPEANQKCAGSDGEGVLRGLADALATAAASAMRGLPVGPRRRHFELGSLSWAAIRDPSLAAEN